MIYNIQTFCTYGYWPEDLSRRSSKPIIAACDECGKIRITSKHEYHDLCQSCAMKKRWKDPLERKKQQQRRNEYLEKNPPSNDIIGRIQYKKQIYRNIVEDGGFINIFCTYNIKTKSIHITDNFGRKSKNGMNGNPECASYLGVYIAEKLLSKVFKNVEKMPYGNPGFDFICGKGYKIDVKSGCLGNNTPTRWLFKINKNTTADYFLCLAFDNKYDLNPMHIWLIPGKILSDKVCTSISKSTLQKWSEYEQPLDKVISCCDTMKGE